MKYIFILFLFSNHIVDAQMDTNKSLPYHQIPEYYDTYSPGNVTARLIDGLGYRYYWASESLKQEDLDYMPSEDGQSMISTIEHVLGLSKTILNCVNAKPNIRPVEEHDLSYSEMRQQTLNNLWTASQKFQTMSSIELEACKVVFQRGDKQSEFPFWNLVNGQISDAIYHTGQMVSFRRTTGNPLNSNVNVFIGKNKN
jgi:hypothetical protein